MAGFPLYQFEVSKQRPSKSVRRKPARPRQPPPGGFQAAYWRRRVFKNTYTRDGQNMVLNGWSVKIQHQGQRRTFSLAAPNREKAAREAWQIYRSIVSPGRDTLDRPRTGRNSGTTSASPKPSVEPLMTKDAGYWKPRLLHRKPLEFLCPRVSKELSVRIEHAGTSHYFLLGTHDEAVAAARAAKIHQTVTDQGWEVANERFDRELTIAFHWSSNPVAWTYATLHTQRRPGTSLPALNPPRQMPSLGVTIIEPDDGVRLALAACVNCQPGFRCEVTFSNATEALRRNSQHRLDLVLVNQLLPDRPGATYLEQMQQTTPSLARLLYGVYEDSDELFRAAPGGAVGYLLKRTSPRHIFEPLAEATGPLTRESIAAQIREYFQNLLTAMPSGPSNPELSKLTAREHEILTLLSKGGVAKDIASTLGISLWTVHGHVKNIFEKLNVHTRTEAVVKFLQK